MEATAGVPTEARGGGRPPRVWDVWIALPTHLYFLAILRIFFGYDMFRRAWGKLTGGFLEGEGVSRMVGRAVEEGTLAGAWEAFLRGTVLPDPVLFAHIVAWGECLLGLSLLLGLGVRVAGTFGVLHGLALWLTFGYSGHAMWVALNLVFVLAAAGRSFGLDFALYRRWPDKPWW